MRLLDALRWKIGITEDAKVTDFPIGGIEVVKPWHSSGMLE
jgi:hypothetical protein